MSFRENIWWTLLYLAVKLGVFINNQIVSDNTLPVMEPNKMYLTIYHLLLQYMVVVDTIYGPK